MDAQQAGPAFFQPCLYDSMVRLKAAFQQACLLALAMAVKREDFKTCEQSAFCKRHRNIKEPTGYEVLSSTVQYRGATFEARLKNPKNCLVLRIFGVADSTVRIQVDEPEGAIRKRFVPIVALDGEPGLKDFHSVEQKTDQTIIYTAEKKSKVVVVHQPFRIDVYDESGDLVVQINKNGKLLVEEYRRKEDDTEYPEGFWEERFKSYHDSKPFGSSSVGVDVSFVGFKHAFGLPEHADTFALKSTVGHTDPYRLYNLDVFEYELHNPMSLYVAIPYIVAHRINHTVGLLWLNSAETWVDTNSSPAGFIRSVFNKVLSTESAPYFDAHFISETGLVDLFFFPGPSPQNVQKQYSQLTGRTPLPPLFSIAYHQCRWNYNDEADVLDVNDKLDQYDIPADVIWLDIEHTEGKRYFTWDHHKFPNPKKMLEKVAAKGRKMVTIVDPHIKKDNGYNVYKDAKDLGLFVKKADGVTDFEGHCWPGASEYLDFLHPETRKYWAAQFGFDRYTGSTPDLFTWNDMNEPSVFSGPEVTMDKDCLHYGGVEHREVHNMYGLLYHSATFEGQMQRTNGRERPFILTRAGFVGTQRTAAIWTGDNTADWGHLAIATPMLLSLSVAGNVFVGADVGGFFGNPDEQLLTRWYQAGAFQPFFRAHAHIDTKRREPWLFSENTRLAIREAIRRRYKLLPFWYTLFREHSLSGVPPMKPIWYEFRNEEAFFAEEKMWMLGKALLVRPIVEKDATSTEIILPGSDEKTRWFDWETGNERSTGSQIIEASIFNIPVFQRGGSIVPTWERVRRSSKGMLEDPLTLYAALDDRNMATGELYVDDGTTHDYKNRIFAATLFEYKSISAAVSILTGQPVDGGSYDAKNWIEKIIIRGLRSAPKSISIIRASDPTKVLEFSFDESVKVLTIRKPNAIVTQSFKVKLVF